MLFICLQVISPKMLYLVCNIWKHMVKSLKVTSWLSLLMGGNGFFISPTRLLIMFRQDMFALNGIQKQAIFVCVIIGYLYFFIVNVFPCVTLLPVFEGLLLSGKVGANKCLLWYYAYCIFLPWFYLFLKLVEALLL